MAGANHANLFGPEDGARFAASPGSFPDGANPYDLMDMSGNVREWTSTVYADYLYDAQDGRQDPNSDRDRFVRGGLWANMAEQAHTTARYKDDLDDWDGLQGFRLALTE